MTKYWCYSVDKKWNEIERCDIDPQEDYDEFLRTQDFLQEPHIVNGDEFNFIAVFQHPFQDLYLIHLVIEDFFKIIYADSLPAALELFVIVNQTLNSYFRTLLMLEDLNDAG